jgi:hypothetical protein
LVHNQDAALKEKDQVLEKQHVELQELQALLEERNAELREKSEMLLIATERRYVVNKQLLRRTLSHK